MKQPAVNELVIGTITRIAKYGAYVNLEEYDTEGFIHISEIAPRWVRNIRNFVKEGQKVVAKVIRVNEQKRQVDLSLRRVTDNEKRKVMEQKKREKRAEGLFSVVVKQVGATEDEAKKMKDKLIKEFGELYFVFEDIARGTAELDLPDKWKKAFEEVTEKHFELPRMEVGGVISIKTLDGKGVEKIKSAFKAAESLDVPEHVKSSMLYLGGGKYEIKVSAYDYKTAEKFMKSYLDELKKYFSDQEFKFERVKK